MIRLDGAYKRGLDEEISYGFSEHDKTETNFPANPSKKPKILDE